MIAPTGPFPREQRIRRSREFRDLTRRGVRRSTETFVVFTAPTVGAGESAGRLGITVSRRVGNAVVRNRLKRRVREWYRQDGRSRGEGLDLLVIARPQAAALDSTGIRSVLSGLLRAGS